MFRHDSGPGEGGVPALRPDPPQHLHQRAGAAEGDAAAADEPRVFLRGRSRAWRATWSRSRRGWWRGARGGTGCGATTPMALPRETALGSLCHYISQADAEALSAGEHRVRLAAGAGRSRFRTGGSGRSRRATGRRRDWANTGGACLSWSGIARFLEELARDNASAHTIRNYGADLRQFLSYFTPPGGEPGAVGVRHARAARVAGGYLRGSICRRRSGGSSRRCARCSASCCASIWWRRTRPGC